MLVEICTEHDLFIISDEVYREFVYDGLEFKSMGSFKEAQQRVIIIDSISKRYSACGARIGSIASKNKELINEIMKLCQGRLCVPTIEQLGAVELYKTSDSYFREVNAEYQKRRDIVYNALQKIDGVICREPKGAFYVSAKLPVDDAEKFIIWCLEKFEYNNETIMMAPLEGFYSTEGMGINGVRIAYILNTDELTKAMSVLKKALELYPGRKLILVLWQKVILQIV
jgi:Aspartate/tyrosine/aromatic aminotransferase